MRDVGRRHVSLPPPPPPRQQTPSTTYIGNNVHVNDRAVDNFRDRRNMDTQVKQTTFIVTDDTNEVSTSAIVPDVAKMGVIGEDKDAGMSTERKSRRKSFMFKVKKFFKGERVGEELN